MNNFLETFAENTFGRSREECFKLKLCVKCGSNANEFIDELSKKEYTLSGFCQKCQDNFFDSNEKSTEKTVEILIAAGANLNLLENEEHTAIMFASRYSNK